MSNPITVSPGEKRTIIQPNEVGEYFADVVGDVGLELREAFSAGGSEQAAPDDRGRIAASRGTEVIAFNPNNSDAEVELSRTGRQSDLSGDGFYFERQNRVVTRVRENQNQTSVSSSQESVTTTAASLSPQRVPDGVDVVVKAASGNGDSVLVGGSTSPEFPLGAGEAVSLGVQNRDDIVAEASSGTQTLFTILESS